MAEGRQSAERERRRGGGGGGGGASKPRRLSDLLPAAALALLVLAAWTSPSTSGSISGWWKPPTQRHALDDSSSARGGSGGEEPAGAGGESVAPAAWPDAATCGDTPCGEALDLPTVALLFLSRGGLPLEATWRLWLEGAVGFLPHQRLAAAQEAACSGDASAWERLACACHPALQAGRQRRHGLPGQHLYTIYVHAPPWPDFKGFRNDSVFSGRVIPRRFKTKWGDISLVEAARSLLAEALAEPRNQRFLLISDSGLPLYDPLTLYQQLLSGERSLIKACGSYTSQQPQSIWKAGLETPRLKQHHMRKSSQFWALTRRHAQLVASDEEVFGAFKRSCNNWKPCTGLPDEYYVPTLLAAMGEGNSTVCDGWGVEWQQWDGSEGVAHPRAFQPADVSWQLLRRARGRCAADAPLSIRAAHRAFTSLGAALASGGSQLDLCAKLGTAVTEPYSRPLPPSCYLLARKFTPAAAPAVKRLYLESCQAISTALPARMSEQDAAALPEDALYLLTGRACAVAKAQGLLAPSGGSGGNGDEDSDGSGEVGDSGDDSGDAAEGGSGDSGG